VALPSNVNFGTVTGRFMRAVADGMDADRDPDGEPIVGLQIMFQADLAGSAVVRNATAAPSPVTILIDPVYATTDSEGYLVGTDGQRSIKLVATDDADLDPHGWTYRVTLSSPSYPRLQFSFALPMDTTVDLTSVVPVPANPGEGIIAWQAAVDETFANKAAAQAAASDAEAAQLAAEAAAEAAVVPTREAVAAVIARVDIRDYILPGESLLADDSGFGNNSAIIQRAVNAVNALWLADGRPRQIFFPDGKYRLADSGAVPGSTTRYAVRWRSGVGIATSSRRGVVFIAPATATAFVAADNASWENLTRVYCDPHVVDGYLQTNATYTSKFKGWFIQGLADSYFDDVKVVNTFSTGFGCDYLVRTRVTGEADNCGRGMKELGIDPLTSSGASGFGIGTGRYEIEDFDLDVVARNCGFHGVFLETQGSEPFKLSKGGRVRAVVEGNYVGFRDCGSDGLQGYIVSRKSVYAEILHDKTILNDVRGANGRVQVDLSDGVRGIVFGTATTEGPYTFEGSVRKMSGAAVGTKSAATIPDHLTLELRVTECIGGAIAIDKASKDLLLKVREWGNSSYGLALTGAGSATDLSLIDCDFRSGGVSITQKVIGNPVISSTTRGLSLDSPGAPRTTSVGADSVSLSWASPLLAAAVTDYLVQYKLPEAGTWTTWAHTASTATTATITGLLRGHTYDFRVSAVASGSTGPASPATRGTAGIPPVIDRFNRASGSLAGATLPDGTVNPAWTLNTTASGVIGVFGSIVAKPTAGGSVVATVPVGVATGAVQMKLHAVKTDVPANRRHGLVFAYQAATSYFRLDTRPTSTILNLGIRKSVSGTATIISQYSRPAAAGDIVRVEFDTTTKRLAWYVNEEFVEAIVDADFTYTLAAGMYGEFTTDPLSSADDFMAWI
jgi:hypothetical protein